MTQKDKEILQEFLVGVERNHGTHTGLLLEVLAIVVKKILWESKYNVPLPTPREAPGKEL